MPLHALLALSALALSAAAEPAPAEPDAPGRLVIVGGALSADNDAVFDAFLAAAKPDAPIAILPAASGYPAGSAADFAAALAARGVAEGRIAVLPLAVMDDPDTDAVDEARWADNVDDPAVIAALEGAGAVWITGGDQLRLAELLLQDDGAPTPALAALQRAHAGGAAIGGTSAGAAAMGPLMIARGDGLAALLDPVASWRDEAALESGRLTLAPGLGLLPGFVTDQHFDARARLGRLARTVAMKPAGLVRGLGVAEDTALVVNPGAGTADVVGRATVVVLDAAPSATLDPDAPFAADAVMLSVLSPGDRLSLRDLAVTPAAGREATAGREYFDRAPASGGGMAVPAPALEDLLGEDLLDNAGAESLSRISFAGSRGVVYRFDQDEAARGWWGRDAQGRGRYTIARVRFSAQPVNVSVSPADAAAEDRP